MPNSSLVYAFFIFFVIVGIACNDDDLEVDTNTSWGVPTQPLIIDSCFSPERFGIIAPLIVPPTEGSEIHKIAFDPLDDNALYITTWNRIVVGREPSVIDSDLYRLDLVNNSSTFITTLNDFDTEKLMLNGQSDLLSSAMGEGTTIFNLSTLELVAENITEKKYPNHRVWASDSTFWISISVLPSSAWTLNSTQGDIIDTINLRVGEASATRNGKTIFITRIRERFTHSLHIFDHAQNRLIDSMEQPQLSDPRLQRGLGTPLWLNDNQVFIHFLSLFMVVDLDTKSYQIVKELLPESCKNYEISSVQVVPNRPNEILYVLNQYFYNELGEYRKRHDLVHFNIETREEKVLLIDL